MLIQGKFLAAFEKFYHDDVIVQENNDLIIKGKAENRMYRKKLMGDMVNYSGASVLKVAVGEDNTTMVELKHDFINKTNDLKSKAQVAIQEWKDGLIIYEKVYSISM